MAQNHMTTAVLTPDGSEKEGQELKLTAYFHEEEKEIIVIELDNKEIFSMDYENLCDWFSLIKAEK